jgi:hypothetical protein
MAHILPVWNNLPDSMLGEVLCVQNPSLSHVKHWGKDDVVMVAGFPDIEVAGGRPTIYVEHGAGQSYIGARGQSANYYHGGEHPENVIAYLGPRQDVIDAWGRPGYACGAPICDPYPLHGQGRTAALTFHWAGGAPHKVGVPEAGTAFEHYVEQMPAIVSRLRKNGWDVIGTRHPRFNRMRGYWERLGVEAVEDAHEVRLRAQLVIADNTSLLYEAMYLGRYVIALNCPDFRRDVEHGLRFWENAPRLQCDDADALIDMIDDLDRIIDRNEGAWDPTIPEYVYGAALNTQGRDGARAAAWLSAFLSQV